MAQIYARRLPPVEQKGSLERMKDIQQAIREPEESPYVGGFGAITAAKLLKEAQKPVMYTPRSLAEAASKARLPVPERQGQQVPQRQEQQVPQQRRVITEEDERILTAQAGGRAAIPQQIENVASRGRHGDTMLMHVNPDELKGLSSLLGPTTTNPDTGLPEAFAWWLPLIGAALGGVATGSWKGAALGGLAGLGGAGFMSAAGIGGTAAGTLGSTWGPFSGLFGGATGLGGGAAGAGLGAGTGAAQGLYGPYAAAMQGAGTGAALGTTGTALTGAQGLSSLPLQGPQRYLPGNLITGSQPALTSTVPLTQVPNTMAMGWTPQSIGAMGATPGVIGAGGPGQFHPAISTLKGQRTNLAQFEPSTYLRKGKEKVTPPWWKTGLDWAKAHPIETGLGALGATALLSQPRQQQIADLPIKEVSEFTFEEKAPRIPKTNITQAQLEEEAEVGPFSSFFEEVEEAGPVPAFSAAKEGGLLSVIKRQLGGPAGFSVHPAIISAGPQAVAQEVKKQEYRYPTSDFGNPQTRATTHPLVIDALSQRSDWPSSWGGIGAGGGNDGIPATVEPPFEFPEVTPFRSVTPFSSSTLEDRLTRIAGQPTTPTQFPQVPLPQQAIPSTNIPDIGALSDLFTRYEEAQDDPIVNLVSSQVAEAIPAQKGGILGLANGGIPNIFAGHVRGVGDGMSDQIPFRVVPQTPQDIPKAPDMAVLSTDEFVFPADAVSMLGNGSSDAGAKILDNAVKSVRRASIGTPKQITEIDGQKVLRGALTT